MQRETAESKFDAINKQSNRWSGVPPTAQAEAAAKAAAIEDDRK